jgi:hypothetical protein
MSENETATSVAVDDQPETSANRLRELLADRRALALIGVAGLVVVLLIAFVLVPVLTGSSASSAPVATGKVTSGSRTTASVTPTASATPTAAPPAAAPLSVRDPFLPLVQGANAGGGTSGGSGTPSATSSPGSTAVASGADVSNLQQLTLVELSGPTTAKVTVNGLLFDVTANVPFGSGFAMTAETGSNATFLYNGQTKTLVPGQYAFFN